MTQPEKEFEVGNFYRYLGDMRVEYIGPTVVAGDIAVKRPDGRISIVRVRDITEWKTDPKPKFEDEREAIAVWVRTQLGLTDESPIVKRIRAIGPDAVTTVGENNPVEGGALSMAETQRILRSKPPVTVGDLSLDPLSVAAMPDIVRERLASLNKTALSEDQIKHMVDRFLQWRLPANFNPDAGISYKRPNYLPEVDATPVGTNLFDAQQAEAMVRFMVEGLAEVSPDAPAAAVAGSAEPVLQDIEQYRMQMAGISTAALGYWKEGESVHPDYDTKTLHDVARLYAKYAHYRECCIAFEAVMVQGADNAAPPSPPAPAMSQCRGINEDQAEAIYDAYEVLREQQSGDRGRDGAIYRLGVAINGVLCVPAASEKLDERN